MKNELEVSESVPAAPQKKYDELEIAGLNAIADRAGVAIAFDSLFCFFASLVLLHFLLPGIAFGDYFVVAHAVPIAGLFAFIVFLVLFVFELSSTPSIEIDSGTVDADAENWVASVVAFFTPRIYFFFPIRW